jgi:hypothetical protein
LRRLYRVTLQAGRQAEVAAEGLVQLVKSEAGTINMLAAYPEGVCWP